MNLRAIEQYVNIKTSARVLLVGRGLLGGAFFVTSCDRNPSPTPVSQSAPIPNLDQFTPFIRFLREAAPTSGEASYPYPPGFFLRHPSATTNNYRDPVLDFRLQVISALLLREGQPWVGFNVDIGRKSKKTIEGGWRGAIGPIDPTQPHTLLMRWRNFTFTDNYLDGRRIGPDPTTLPQV